MTRLKPFLMTLLVLIFGLFPLLLLLVWVERNMAIPGLGSLLMEKGVGLPWVFIDGGPKVGIIANILMLSSFVGAQLVLAKLPDFRVDTVLPSPVNFLAVLDGGISAVILMGLWQPTGVVLFQLIPAALPASLLSFFLFWTFLAVAFKNAEKKNFVPIFLFLAFFFTPMLSLDRLIFGVFALGLASMLHFMSLRKGLRQNGHSK